MSVYRWLVDGLEMMETAFCICANTWSQQLSTVSLSWFQEAVITVDSVQELASTIGHVYSTSQAASAVSSMCLHQYFRPLTMQFGSDHTDA